MKRLGKLLLTHALLLVTPLRATERPDILFIFCDDLTNEALSCLGDLRKLLEAPNIDRLAAHGKKFRRCLVPNSICGPSRATALIGKWHLLTPEQRKQWDAYDKPRNAKFRAAKLSGKELVRWHYQRYLHDHLGAVTAMDESTGRI